jgi:hypothetical protein
VARRVPVARRWVLAGAGVAGVAAVSVAVAAVAARVPEPSSGTGYRMTPAMLSYASFDGEKGARGRLEKIADVAAAQPVTPSDLPEHLKMKGWYLFTDATAGFSATMVEEIERWRNLDNSGLEAITEGDTVRYNEYRAGEMVGMWAPGNDRPPTGTAAAKEWLKIGHPAENGPAETIVAVTDLFRERVLSPAERAAVLRVVAQLPGLKANGRVEDRAGRVGEAFSIESGYSGLLTRYTLIVNPATGELLGYEQMLTKSAGKLNVKIPSVIGYESYLASNHAALPK